MGKRSVLKPIGDVMRAAGRALAIRSGSAPVYRSLAPRVSLVGMLGIGAISLILTLTAASTVTLLRLRAGMSAEVSGNMNRIQAELRGLERELMAVEQSLTGTCDQIRPSLVRASIDSALSRQILYRLPGEGVLCGPLGGRESDISAALDGYSERLPTDESIPRLGFESMPTIEPGLLTLRAGALGGILIAQLDLKRLSNLIGAPRGDSGRSIQLNLAQGGNYRLASRAQQSVVSSGVLGSLLLTSVRAADVVYPMVLISTLTVRGFADEMWPLLFPTFALAAALAALLISRLNTRLAHRASPENRLRRAVRLRQFEPVVQPIVDARTGRCLGGEVLMRWDHPVRGLVPPVEFIAQAEQTGLIIPMTEIMMRKARDRLATTLKDFPDLYFSFNVTVGQLADPKFPDFLDRLFDEQSLPPRNVFLEMIERDAVDAQVSAGLTELRRRGYRIAIDDFGTGQSSLSVLSKIECDRLKIDREFVRAIDEDASNRPVLDAIIELARRLNLSTIAEGVETQAQRAYLCAQGVGALQGYLIAKPLPISEFLIWLGDNDAWARSAEEAGRIGQVSRIGQVDVA